MKWSHWFLYVVCLPWNLIIAWPAVLLIRLFWGKGLRWEKPPAYDYDKGGGGGWCLSCQMKDGSFPVVPGTFPKGWYFRKKDNRPWGGTALGHGVFYGPNGRNDENWGRCQAHEHIHVEQFEVAMLHSFIVGLVAGIVLLAFGHIVAALWSFFGIWFTGSLLKSSAAWLTAALRGEEPYWGSTHEESARAQDDGLKEQR